ncbi:hypothetical protein BDK51DRAFT_29325 [Blyttiomyces helicus]|uniref:Uncharacterized protein n=1 Tax=Blyttiomyces helicus TaxID=388810 RepID=A0A4P9W6V4_9FUNG|nr:hypothetical protein BDK51DRAFT_29325 [Blyttiomyces helicus]|eukprot:RKO86698.1 hypothetical protein BDK51DRAFT_29325 [Blyttiomyces helicus]
MHLELTGWREGISDIQMGKEGDKLLGAEVENFRGKEGWSGAERRDGGGRRRLSPTRRQTSGRETSEITHLGEPRVEGCGQRWGELLLRRKVTLLVKRKSLRGQELSLGWLTTPLPATSRNQVTFLDKLGNNGKKDETQSPWRRDVWLGVKNQLGGGANGRNVPIQRLKKICKKPASKSKSDNSEGPPKKSFKKLKDVKKVAGAWTKVVMTFLKDMQPLDQETQGFFSEAAWEIFPPIKKILQMLFGNVRTKVTENEAQNIEDLPKFYQEYLDALGKPRKIDIKGPPSEIHREKIHIQRKRAAAADDVAAEDNAAEESADDTLSGARDVSGQDDSREDTDAGGDANVDSGDENKNIENNEHLAITDSVQLARQIHSSSGLLSSLGPLPLSISINESLFPPSTFSTRDTITVSQPVRLEKPLPIKLPTDIETKSKRKAYKPRTMKKLPVSTNQVERLVLPNGVVNIFAPLSQQKLKNTDSYKGPVGNGGSSADYAELKVVPMRVKTRTPGKNESAAQGIMSDVMEVIIGWLTKLTDGDSVEVKKKQRLKAELARGAHLI